MGRNPSPLERAETGLRKTSVTRELPVGDAGHAPSAFAHPSSGRPDNSSLHDVNAGKDAGERSENRSQRQESLPAPHPEFWLLICSGFRQARSNPRLAHAYFLEFVRGGGGARRDRTDDLLLAKQALSQLSYGPVRDQSSAISNQKEARPSGRGILMTEP